MEVSFEVEGMSDFIETVDRLIEGIKPDKVEPILSKGANPIAREVRSRTPIGPTGNLKKAVKKKKLQRYFGAPAPYIVAFDRKKAPHAWLVTHGTSGVRRVDPPHHATLGGKKVLITQTGIMPPNRFFTESIEAKKDQALTIIEKGVGDLLEEAMK